MSITKIDEIPVTLWQYRSIVFIVNILSHKWALFILLSLQEPKRFNQLRRYLNISHSVLSKELKGLEKLKIIHRRIILEDNPPSVEYSLTEYGEELLTICLSMKTFGDFMDGLFGKPDLSD